MRVFKRIFEAIMLDVFFVQNTEGMRQARGKTRRMKYRVSTETHVSSRLIYVLLLHRELNLKKNSAKNWRAMSLLL